MPRHNLLASLTLLAAATAQSPIPLPPHTNTGSTNLTRGFYFQAPVNCVVAALETPNVALKPHQVVEFLDFGTSAPPAFPATATGTQLFYDNATPAGRAIPTNIPLTAGHYYGVFGVANDSLGGVLAYHSFGDAPFTSNILGTPTTLSRLLTQFSIGATGGNHPCSGSAGWSMGRVFIDIVPGTGVHPRFSASVTMGVTPLTVDFSDDSISNPNPVTSWAWDFENDGTIDSTLQNPTHIYTLCGSYDVALTIDDGSGPVTVIKTAYITTDVVAADFTEAPTAPLTVQFTDTSTGSPTSWDWDLDGDGTTDSTAQNPVFTYPNIGPVTATLTTSRLCGAADTTSRRIVPAQQLTTTFADNNGLRTGATMMFDMDVRNTKGIAINGFDVSSGTTPSSPITVEVYVTSGTFVGKETSPEEWSLVGTATGMVAGSVVPTWVGFPAPVYVAPGDYGIALHHIDANVRYTNGNGSNQQYANGDLALDLGTARNTNAGSPFGSGGTYNPRVWNGTIYYDTCNLGGGAGYGYTGTGCAGSNGIPTLTAQGNPILGTTLNVDISNLAVNAAVMMTGLSNTNSALGPLPIDGTPFGAAGCFLRVSPDANVLVLGSGGTATWSLPIPNDPSLNCTLLFQQALALDPATNVAGAVLSHAAGFVLGN